MVNSWSKLVGKIILVNILDQPRYMLERIDIIPDLIPEEHIFKNFKSCLDWVDKNLNHHE